MQASDEDEPGKKLFSLPSFICAAIIKLGASFPPTVTYPSKGNKKNKVCKFWYGVLHLHPCEPSAFGKWPLVSQGGNIFAALSQGQSGSEDEDGDLDEEDKPLKKVWHVYAYKIVIKFFKLFSMLHGVAVKQIIL